MSATLNGSRAVSVRILAPWRGAWSADVVMDPADVDASTLIGAATIVIGETHGPVSTLQGTIDPRYSGTFIDRPFVRVVGGAGAWDKTVTAQHFHNDGGVTSSQVYQATAAQIGERVVDLAPTLLGADFVRSVGPASRVLADVDWFVDLDGVTQVGPRPSVPDDASLTVLDWDPIAQRAELQSDGLILPGAIIADARIGAAAVTVRDVEQTFTGAGTHAIAWCAIAPATRLLSAFGSLVRELGGIAFVKRYRYRVVLEGSDGRLQLQAVQPSKGVPDTLPLTVWPGASGLAARLKPSSEVLVEFVAGDKTQPIVSGFSSAAIPLENTIDASVAVHVGPSAAAIQLAGGGHSIAFADALFLELGKIATAINGIVAGSYAPPASAALIGSTKASVG